MELHIESPHVQLNPSLKEEVQSKFDHLGRKYQRIEHGEVVFRKEKNREQKSYCVEATLHLPGTTLFASEKHEMFEKAVDNLVNDLEHQLQRHKEETEERR